MTKELGIYNGTKILFTEDKMINLADMWKASNEKASRKPTFWLRLPDSEKFLKSLSKKHGLRKSQLINVVKGRGKAQGTYAHYQIAMAYAKYLSPEFHIWCNEVVKTFILEEQNPDLGIDRAVANYKKQGKSDSWIERRITGKLTHNKFIKEFGRTGAAGDQYKTALGLINENVLGMPATDFQKKTGVKVTRDGATEAGVAIIAAVQALATEALESAKQEAGYVNPDEALKIIGKTAQKFKGILA